ncbi:hypothetical protein DPMN_139886 [Dreissena polymorpha]|uniref:Exonuclease domain-containing protein n=1 Tax=Dreissena polymorpha TaxID=45954 RepID=A0A9D4JG42_DREPO|nr:hypothetical protein DPMN_139886 [Dreissena polymorpha]
MYQSGIGHEENVDTEKIPDPIPKANFKPVKVNGEPTVIAFDLETTGLIEGRVLPQITQIAATELESGSEFQTYIKPTIEIGREASDITGIAMVNGEMTVNGEVVKSVPVKSGIEQFITWVSRFRNVCLIAHNGRRFDFPILVSILRKGGNLEKISTCAFIDSMSVFRKLYSKQSLKQVDLVSTLLGETYDAHNAIADVVALGKLVQFVKLPAWDLMAHSFSPRAVSMNMDFNNAKALNLPSLSPLVSAGIFKRPTAENIAGSGLQLVHLKTLHSRGGEDAIRDVFKMNNSEGLPRVSSNKKVLEDVVPKIAFYFENQQANSFN